MNTNVYVAGKYLAKITLLKYPKKNLLNLERFKFVGKKCHFSWNPGTKFKNYVIFPNSRCKKNMNERTKQQQSKFETSSFDSKLLNFRFQTFVPNFRPSTLDFDCSIFASRFRFSFSHFTVKISTIRLINFSLTIRFDFQSFVHYSTSQSIINIEISNSQPFLRFSIPLNIEFLTIDLHHRTHFFILKVISLRYLNH